MLELAQKFKEVQTEMKEVRRLLKREFSILEFSLKSMEEKIKNVSCDKNREF